MQELGKGKKRREKHLDESSEAELRRSCLAAHLSSSLPRYFKQIHIFFFFASLVFFLHFYLCFKCSLRKIWGLFYVSYICVHINQYTCKCSIETLVLAGPGVLLNPEELSNASGEMV